MSPDTPAFANINNLQVARVNAADMVIDRSRFRDLVLNVPRTQTVAKLALPAQVLPHFAADEAAKLQTTPLVSITTDAPAGSKFRALAGWMSLPAANTPATNLRVVCVSNQLTARIETTIQGVSLLPMSGDGIAAALVYKIDGAPQSRPLSVVFDQDAHTLTMLLPFADRAAYDEVVGALVTSGSEAHLQVQCSHLYNVTVTERHFNWPQVVVAKPVMMSPMVLGRAVQPAAAVAPAHVMPFAAAGLSDRAIKFQTADRLPIDIGGLLHRGVGDTLGGLTTTTTSEQTQTFVHSFALPLHFPAANPDVFPDLPAQHQSVGGDRFRGRTGRCSTRTTASPRSSTCRRSTSSATTPKQPQEIRRDAFRDLRQSGRRVSHQGHADRGAVHLGRRSRDAAHPSARHGARRHGALRRDGSRLGAAVPLRRRFHDEHRHDRADGEHSISGTGRGARPAPRARVRDGRARLPIFCEMLRHGLHGKVQVDAVGIQPQIDVGLRSTTSSPTRSPRLPEDYPSLTANLILRNGSATPGRFSFIGCASMTVSLIDKGSVPGLILNLQEVTLLQAQTVGAKGSVTAAITPSIPTWDAVVVSGGPGSVDGGSADDWFARVHRDPSLQPRDFSITPQILLPTGGDRVQLVRMKLFKDAEPAPRVDRQVAPAAPQPLTFPLTLTELMGTGAERPHFVIEYQSIYSDNTTSLVQRMSVDPDQHVVSLQALVEAPSSTYTVEYDDHGPQHVDGDRAAASQLIDRLRTEGKTWSVYVHAAAPRPADPTPDTHTPTPVTPDPLPVTTPATSTATVTIITDLLTPAFASQGLKRAFVVLQATTTGAPSSTIVIEATTPAPVVWQPTGGTIPPFNYRITYLYEGAVSKKVEGTESNLLLVLDPPAP
jgi:hypothetical protein